MMPLQLFTLKFMQLQMYAAKLLQSLDYVITVKTLDYVITVITYVITVIT